MWNLVRALALSQQRGLLRELASYPDPTMRLILALAWGFVFWGLAEALRRRRPFTRRAIPFAIAGYALYEIGLLYFFAQDVLARQTLGLDALLAVGAVGLSYWALNRTAVSPYFINQEPA